MLVAIVGLRVAVLKLGSSVGSQIQQATMLESSNTTLRARISALSDNRRIETMAEAYGMHMPNPLDVHFVAAGTASQLRPAVRNISAPASATFLTGLAGEQQNDLRVTQQGSSLSAVGATTGAASNTAAAGAAGATSTSTTTSSTGGTGVAATNGGATTGAATNGSTPAGQTTASTSSSTTGSSSSSTASTASNVAGSSTESGSLSTGATVTGSPGATLNTGSTNTDANANPSGAGSVTSSGGTGLAG